MNLSSKDSFIPIFDPLQANLRKANVYSVIAEIFSSLANLKATKVEIVRVVELLTEAYQVDPKLTKELLHFYLYARKTTNQGLIAVVPKPFSVAAQFKKKQKSFGTPQTF